jgi:hypothetical protein
MATELGKRPAIVTLCGSTRFWQTFQRASLQETLAGKIVLSIGAATGTDDEHFGNLPAEQYFAVKEMLDELHLHKVAMADEVLVLNVGGYVGQSTAREVAFAVERGKPLRWWEGFSDGWGWEWPVDAASYGRIRRALEQACGKTIGQVR